MRLDKYLKVSRLIKRRTVANEVADAGRILINGKIAKASQAVKEGDIIEVTFGNRPIKVKVLSDVEPPHQGCGPGDVRNHFGITSQVLCTSSPNRGARFMLLHLCLAY